DWLSFGPQLGRGASGATVLRCTQSARALQTASAGADGTEDGTVQCAAKVLPLSNAIFADMVEDFGREVDLLRSLGRHSCLLGFFGAWRLPAGSCSLKSAQITCEAYVLCIELCDAALEDVVQRRCSQKRAFAQHELMPCLAQVSTGLAYLHSRGVMHRDMKSANVFLQHDLPPGERLQAVTKEDFLDLPLHELRAKLGDFGAAKAAERAQTPVQTPQFMAPEVCRQEAPYGLEADLWGFGSLLHELLELSVPYGQELTFPELEQKLLAGVPPALSDRAGAEQRCPSLVPLMDSCLRADPAARPTAGQVVEELARMPSLSAARQPVAAAAEVAHSGGTG
ncbi:unnamed protein product, partial [Polarella glacialis]